MLATRRLTRRPLITVEIFKTLVATAFACILIWLEYNIEDRVGYPYFTQTSKRLKNAWLVTSTLIMSVNLPF